MLGGWTVFVSVLFFLAWLLPLLCGRGVNCVLFVLAGVLPLLGGRGVYCVWFILAWLLPLLGCVLCAVCSCLVTTPAGVCIVCCLFKIAINHLGR